jgi:hypothetical protein
MVGVKINPVSEDNILFSWMLFVVCCALAVVTWEMMKLEGVTAVIGVFLLLPWCSLLFLFTVSHIAKGLEVMTVQVVDETAVAPAFDSPERFVFVSHKESWFLVPLSEHDNFCEFLAMWNKGLEPAWPSYAVASNHPGSYSFEKPTFDQSLDSAQAKIEPTPINEMQNDPPVKGGRVSVASGVKTPGVWITSNNAKQGLPCIAIYADDQQGLVIGMYRSIKDKGCAFSIGMAPDGEVRLQSIKDGEVVILDFHPLMKALHAIASIGSVSSGS